MTGHAPVCLGDLTGKTAVITGANSGLGFQISAALAGAGAQVVLAGRQQAALGEAAGRIRLSHPAARPGTVVLDLADQQAIRSSAEEITGRYPAIDMLINNAGVMAIPQRRLTADGFELTFGTNHLGHFALTGLLLPALLAAPAARVVTVSAVIARRAAIDPGNLDFRTGYRPFRAYGASKLANILFATELAQRSTGTGLTSVAVHPGTALTGIQRHASRVTQALARILLERLVGQSPADAARPALLAATGPGIENGGFYAPAGRGELRGYPAPVPLPPAARDPDLRRRLWQASEELTGVHFDLPAATRPDSQGAT
jgi:NAD(P)-dependent dehydrogenase (short-subunit alcohol dehydrogenase family)